MRFKGRLSWKQYNPSKRARFGIKYYKLCESKSGYIKYFEIYTGRSSNEQRTLPVSTKVVLDLIENLPAMGHCLYTDNWHSSPYLFLNLLHRNFNAVGTVKCNRKQMPIDMKKDKQKMNRGDVAVRSCGTLMALRWKDKKDIFMLSTFHTGEMKFAKTSRNGDIFKPHCVLDYNMNMGGIDRGYQLLATFPIMRKYMKSYKIIFFYVFDMMLLTSFICYKKNWDYQNQKCAITIIVI
ncbi:PGBD4 (predicted) [Pycnogonum litorale]